MNKAMWDRWAPLSGTVFVGLLIATFFLPTKTPPDAGDSPATWVSFIEAHRTAILANAYVSGLAIVFFLFFLGALVTRMRGVGEDRLAAVALGGGLVLAGLALIWLSLQAAIAWGFVNDLDPGDVKTLMAAPMFGFGFPLAALVGATSVAAWRSQLWKRRAPIGLVAALWFLVGGAAFARNGFFSPQGTYGFISFIVFLAWVASVSGLLFREPAKGEVPEAASAAM